MVIVSVLLGSCVDMMGGCWEPVGLLWLFLISSEFLKGVASTLHMSATEWGHN